MGPMGRIWSRLLCFGQTPHMTAVNCCIIFAKAFLFILEFFHQLAGPNCSGFGPRGFKALSPQTVFPGGGPLMESIDAHPESAGGIQVSEESDGRSVASPSRCRQSLDSSWPLTHPGSILSRSCGSSPQCDMIGMFLSASSL